MCRCYPKLLSTVEYCPALSGDVSVLALLRLSGEKEYLPALAASLFALPRALVVGNLFCDVFILQLILMLFWHVFNGEILYRFELQGTLFR